MCDCTRKMEIGKTGNMNMLFIDPMKALSKNQFTSDLPPFELEMPPITATGFVVDEFGTPIPKVHVFVDKNFGTYTDNNGFFVLDEVLPSSLISFSHVGKGTELREAYEDMGEITMEWSAENLDAVYIQGIKPPAPQEIVVKSPQSEKKFPWLEVILGVAVPVVSTVIISRITKPKTFKGAV